MASDKNNTDDGPQHDYLAVSPPPDVAPEDLTYVQRRAEILDRILQVGTPTGIDRPRLARHYSVDRSTIKRDVDALKEYLGDALTDDEAVLAETFAIRRKVLADLLSADEWRASSEAWTVQREWCEFLGFSPGEDATEDAANDDVRHPAYRDRKPGESVNPGHGVSDEQKAAFERMHKKAEKATEPLRVDTDGDGRNNTDSGGEGDE